MCNNHKPFANSNPRAQSRKPSCSALSRCSTTWPCPPASERTRGHAMVQILIAGLLASCGLLRAQEQKTYILAAHRSGAVEIIDPATLRSMGRIRFGTPPNNGILDAAYASTDGSKLYVEGGRRTYSPVTGPGGCCMLWSVNLSTLRVVAVGSTTPHAECLIIANGVVYRSAELFGHGAANGVSGCLSFLNLSADHHWLVGPDLDLHDLAKGTIVPLALPRRLRGDRYTAGTWSGDRFYLYAWKNDGSTSRLWTLLPGKWRLGQGVWVEPFGEAAGCSKFRDEGITSAGGKLFLYEKFGFKGDRRAVCSNPRIPGGAWQVDSETGKLLRHVAADLHFSELLSDGVHPMLYGLASQDAGWSLPASLVRIDATTGRVLQSRVLGPDFWRITLGPLGATPTGDVGDFP
jgi:hypothetical protein